jgi:hypothetical protein
VTRAALRPPPQDRVPVEFIGAARVLRDKIAAAHAVIEQRTETLIASFRPRDNFTPFPKRAMIERLLRRLRAQRSLARLRLVSSYKDGKLQLAELRAEPARVTLPRWGAAELSILISMRTLAIRPPAFAQMALPMAFVGIHALSRRFQRGEDRSDAAVLRDLEALGRSWRTAVEGTIEFAVPAPGGGRWIGAQHLLGEAPVLAVRTFVVSE